MADAPLYLTIQEWIDLNFSPENRPHHNTVRKWIKAGAVATKRFGHQIYVINERVANPENDLEALVEQIAAEF